MNNNEKFVLAPDCRGVKEEYDSDYNPYDRVMYLESDEGSLTPYLCVSDRLTWLHRYCENFGLHCSVRTEPCVELTRKGMITMRALVTIGEDTYTGYGSRLVNTVEGYSGDDIEAAETRAIGRALRNAGFGSPFGGESDEKTPVDGAKPQNIPTYNTNPMDATAVLNAITDDTEPEQSAMQESQGTPEASATAFEQIRLNSEPDEPTKAEPLDVQLAKALKKEYPFKPWPQTPVYLLLEHPELKNKLTWLVEQYSGKEEIKKWAAFVLKYVCPEGQTEKQIYLAARNILREEGLIK